MVILLYVSYSLFHIAVVFTMPISGYFSEFSFPEVLRFIHNAHKTGCLQTREVSDLHTPYYLWFRSGEIVAIQHQQFSLQTILTKINKRASKTIQSTIEKMRHALTQPIGTLLKQQGIVQPEELQIAFNLQVLQPLAYHFSLDKAWFKFEVDRALPFEEMTGLSLAPIQASLIGLRRLEKWESLQSKMPDPMSRLHRRSKTFMPYHLDKDETYTWVLAGEKMSLIEMSKKLGVSVEEMQKVAFRLIVTGLIEECPDTRPTTSAVQMAMINDEMKSEPLQASFISNLLGFLKQRA